MANAEYKVVKRFYDKLNQANLDHVVAYLNIIINNELHEEKLKAKGISQEMTQGITQGR